MVEIRKITHADNIEELIDAINRCLWSENSEIEPNDYSVAGISQSLEQDNHTFCAAYHEGEFAGMASAFTIAKPDGDVWLYVNEVDVVLEKQRLGVGSALMKFLSVEADKAGAVEMWLGTEKDNVPANALYQSLQPGEVEDFVGYTFKCDR